MKQAEIQVGTSYYTRVSGDMVRVMVCAIVESTTRAGRTLTRYRVQRLDTGKILPKARPASALHTTQYHGYAGTTTEE